ncbi:MAG: hypothetical protein RLZZ450_918, partial [Pseudomonadota bacterium]
MDPTLGTVIADKYRLDRVLGKGGMSAVYAATNELTGKQVAIKLLQREGSGDDEHSLRLMREAQTASAIDHPNVVNVFDVGRHEGALFLVMELLYGESLSALLLRGVSDPNEFVRLMMPVLRGVHAAHRCGVIHRDLKPDNILLCTDPHGEPREPKVLDFGISKLTDKLARGKELTREGTVFGTPQYMAPEQMRDARMIDARCDVYALGVIFYRALSGDYPYNADSIGALAIRIVEGKATPLAELCPMLDAGLADVVMRALHPDPEQRFQSVQELGEALEPYADGVFFFPGAAARESATQLRRLRVPETVSGSRLLAPPRTRTSPSLSGVAARAGGRVNTASSIRSAPSLPLPSPAVALAIESYRARVVAAPLLPTAAIELSELTETAQPPPLPMSAVPSELQATLYSRGQGARVPSYLGSRARGGASDHDSLPSDEGQLCRSHPRLSTWSPRRGLWIAAALLGVGVVAPVAGQLWRPAADAHARSAPAAPAFGKTADVSALTKKDKPVAAAPTARRSTTRSTAIGSSPAKGESRVPSLPRGVDLSMSESESLMVARPRQGLVSDRV